MPYPIGRQRFYATWEAAQLWEVSTRTVQRWIENKKLSAYVVGLDPKGIRYIYLISPSEIRRVSRRLRREAL